MVAAAANSTAPPPDRVLTITRVFDAPRQLVFEAWTKPEHVVRWWGPKHFTLRTCEQDFRVGGKYRFCMRAPDGSDHWVWGEYHEIVEPQRLVFSWHREDADGKPFNESVVTVTFAAHEGGKTKLTMHQAVFWTVEDRDAHQGGWSQCLDRLGAFVETQDGKDRNMTQVSSGPTMARDGKLEYADPGVTTAPSATQPSRAAFWTGWVISGLVILWMGVLGLVIFFTKRSMMEEGMAKYGYPANAGVPIFIVEMICVLLYAIPRTSVLGAILLTGYLGGAVATHVRAGEPWFMPVIFGVLVWLGLVLRDPRLRSLVPLRGN